jgi:anti-sigma B factor antagonist
VDITTREKEGVTILELSGEIDLSNSSVVRQAIISGFKKKKARLLVNLDKVSHIDSSGLATLVEGLQLADRGGGWFGICSAHKTVKDVFDIAHLGDVFQMFESEDLALAKT